MRRPPLHIQPLFVLVVVSCLLALGGTASATRHVAEDSWDYLPPGEENGPARGSGAQASGGRQYRNGRLPRSALAPIYHPRYALRLRKDAAAAWNTMRMYSRYFRGVELHPTGKISAYRTYEQQVYAKRKYGRWAAKPGRSRHGLGIAVDLATKRMRRTIDRIGRRFGWAKKWSDAPHEWWHLSWRKGVWWDRPDPGPNYRYPIAREGSGGFGQRWFVERLQRLLRRAGYRLARDGSFGPETAAAVEDFQRSHGLKVDGVVRKWTWRTLQEAARR